MSATSNAGMGAARSTRAVAQERIDVLAAERPVVVEIGNDRRHERRRKPNGPLLVAEVIIEDRQRQLLRAVALVGPLEAELGEALDLVVLVEPLAVDRDHQAVDGALALIGFHGSYRPGFAREALHVVQELVAGASGRLAV